MFEKIKFIGNALDKLNYSKRKLSLLDLIQQILFELSLSYVFLQLSISYRKDCFTVNSIQNNSFMMKTNRLIVFMTESAKPYFRH